MTDIGSSIDSCRALLGNPKIEFWPLVTLKGGAYLVVAEQRLPPLPGRRRDRYFRAHGQGDSYLAALLALEATLLERIAGAPSKDTP